MKSLKKIAVGVACCLVSMTSYAQFTPPLPASAYAVMSEKSKNKPVICSLEKSNCLDGNQVDQNQVDHYLESDQDARRRGIQFIAEFWVQPLDNAN